MRKRPLAVWVVTLGLVVCGLAGGLRMAAALRGWDWLTTLGISPGPLYLAISGGLFLLAFPVAAVLLLWGENRNLAALAVRGVCFTYALWYWGDRLLLTRDEATRANLPFALVFSLVLLGYVYAVISLEMRREV